MRKSIWCLHNTGGVQSNGGHLSSAFQPVLSMSLILFSPGLGWQGEELTIQFGMISLNYGERLLFRHGEDRQKAIMPFCAGGHIFHQWRSSLLGAIFNLVPSMSPEPSALLFGTREPWLVSLSPGKCSLGDIWHWPNDSFFFPLHNHYLTRTSQRGGGFYTSQ